MVPSMKLLLPLLSLALFSAAAFAQEAPGIGSPYITVTGTAVTEVVPDRLLWSLALKNTGPELPQVAGSHSSLLGTLLKILKDLGIDPAAVQTSQMEFGENRVYRNHEHVKEGYYASTSVSFKLADIGKYKEVWLRLASVNDLSVTSVTYDHSKRIDLQKETRTKALLAAKEKAAAMAGALDTKIGEVLSIREDAEASPAYGNRLITANIVQSLAVGADDGGEPLAPGTIPIRSRTVVTFQLQGAAK